MRSRAVVSADQWPAIEFTSTSGRLAPAKAAIVPIANANRFSIIALMAVRSTTFGIVISKRRTSAPNAGWNFQSSGTTGNLQFTRIGSTTLDYVTNNTPLSAFLSRPKRWAWLLCEYNEDYGAGVKVRMSVRDYFGGRWINATFGTATDGATYTDDSAQGIRIGNNQGGGAGNTGRLMSLCAVTNPLSIGLMRNAIDGGRILSLRNHAITFMRPGAWMFHAMDEGRFFQGLNSSEQWRIANTYQTDWKISRGPPYLLVDGAYDLEEQDEEIGSSAAPLWEPCRGMTQAVHRAAYI